MTSDCIHVHSGLAIWYIGAEWKNVESIWKDPGITVKAKSDTLFIVKSRREVRTMHHDKLKKCEATEIPR